MRLTCFGSLLLSLGAVAQSASSSAPAEVQGRLLVEQKHFVDSLITVYNPGLWISYDDGLYFLPKTDDQVREIDALKAARSRYVTLTNRLARHDILAAVMADSGIAARWRKKLLLPYSEANQNLTPTLERDVRLVSRYKVIQNLGGGDALLQVNHDAPCFVMQFGRGAGDLSGTNAWLIKEGTKSLRTLTGEYTVWKPLRASRWVKRKPPCWTRSWLPFAKRPLPLSRHSPQQNQLGSPRSFKI